MKKFLYFILLALPLFLCPSVYADTYDVNVSNIYFDEVIDHLPTLINVVDDYAQANPYNGSSDYIILATDYTSSSSFTIKAFICKSSAIYKQSVTRYHISFMASKGADCASNEIVFSNNFSTYTVTRKTTNYFPLFDTSRSFFTFLYSTFDISFYDTTNDVINIKNGDNTYTVIANINNKFLHLQDIYNSWHSTPLNNYPILTTFYTTVSEKIILFANNLLDNYIYLCIFGIFILIFLIELIRRYLL